MLHELRIENLLLMERAELRLAPGLNVLTGETGAGKTLLAHALDLLLGGRARSGIVREGAPEAYVEGIFSIPPELDSELRERLPEAAEELVLARRVWPDGRTRAYVGGRASTVADLRELGGRMLAFYGQHEHRRLMFASAQLEILDELGGEPQRALRDLVAHAYEQVRELRRELDELRELAGAGDRELDLLSFELDEIEAAALTEAEEVELLAERERLRHGEALRGAVVRATEGLSPVEGAGAIELLAAAAQGIEAAAAIDPGLVAVSERLRALRFEAEDLGGELRGYLEAAETPPGRLEEVEERMETFSRLARKHGGSVADVLRHAVRCRERREQLVHADSALEGTEMVLGRAEHELEALAVRLSDSRRAAADRLERSIGERLSQLAMPDARFAVEVSPRVEGPGPRGADSVEFSLTPNAGLAPGPLREIASGGELSRVMLALLSVAHGGDEARRGERPLLVFDEIDAGIGGHTARAVGEQLRRLSQGRQILCITHLPQVAALGARHFTIVKDGSVVPARTSVQALIGDGVVGELVRMLGAGEDDRAASQHARQLLRAA